MKGNDYSLYLSSLDYFKFMCPIIHCLHSKIVIKRYWGKKDLSHFSLAVRFTSVAKNIESVFPSGTEDRVELRSLALHAIENSND